MMENVNGHGKLLKYKNEMKISGSEENKMGNNIVYLEVCYGNVDSICIRATKRLSKADAQYYTLNDALRLGFEVKQVTRVIELSEEEAYSAFDMERETPVFEPRYKR